MRIKLHLLNLSQLILIEENTLTDSNKEKASDTDDRGSASLAMELHEDKVLRVVDAKAKVTKATEGGFLLPAVGCLPTTVGCSVTTITITDKPKLDLDSDHAELEEVSNRKTRKSAPALEVSNPCQEEIPEVGQKKEDEDFDEDFQNTFDGHFPGSSSRQGQSLPSRVFCHGDSYRHETPAANLSSQVGRHKSYEELHFGRPPEEKSFDRVARECQGNKAEAATQTDEQDLLGWCSGYGSVKIPSGRVAEDAEQPSEEEGAVGGVLCPSGYVNGPTDPTSSHSGQGEQRDSVGELMVEFQPQEEELIVSSLFPTYGPPAFIHLEDTGVVIEDNNGHTILSTLLAGPRLVQNQALEVATRVLERTDFTLRWAGGALIPWNTLLGLPHDQGSSSSRPTTVQVQPAQEGDGEWRVHWTDGQDPILQPPDDQEENAGDSSMQVCLLEGSHGPQQQHEASSSAQGSQTGPAQPLTVQPDTAEEQEYGDSRCTICKEERGQLVITPCHHLFHPVCLYRWIAETDSCPNCRKPVKECSDQN
ncbi:SYVN1 [Branchiostoma lanceolatum]|uniref:SYVN1 protein n=1 Tax=Branchiostoma lanceolatum TaxID=7740 RepID=A0A8K0EPE7_BRALA|nr:SYVN1 [Branchiostoma lanceolatum]